MTCKSYCSSADFSIYKNYAIPDNNVCDVTAVVVYMQCVELRGVSVRAGAWCYR